MLRVFPVVCVPRRRLSSWRESVRVSVCFFRVSACVCRCLRVPCWVGRVPGAANIVSGTTGLRPVPCCQRPVPACPIKKRFVFFLCIPVRCSSVSVALVPSAASARIARATSPAPPRFPVPAPGPSARHVRSSASAAPRRSRGLVCFVIHFLDQFFEQFHQKSPEKPHLPQQYSEGPCNSVFSNSEYITVPRMTKVSGPTTFSTFEQFHQKSPEKTRLSQ